MWISACLCKIADGGAAATAEKRNGVISVKDTDKEDGDSGRAGVVKLGFEIISTSGTAGGLTKRKSDHQPSSKFTRTPNSPDASRMATSTSINHPPQRGKFRANTKCVHRQMRRERRRDSHMTTVRAALASANGIRSCKTGKFRCAVMQEYQSERRTRMNEMTCPRGPFRHPTRRGISQSVVESHP